MRPATPQHPADVQQARELLARTSVRALAMFMIGWAAGAPPLVAFAWQAADHRRLIAWTVATAGCGWLTAGSGALAARRSTPDRSSRFVPLTYVALALTGITLALACLAVRSPGDTGPGFLTQVWVVGCTTSLLLYTRVPLRTFLALAGPALGLDAALVATGEADLPRGWAAFALCSLGCLLVGRHRQYSETLRALAGELTGRRLATEVGEANARLEYRATHDALTGLASRETFLEQAQAALEVAEPLRMALLVIDVDRFKTVNDALGHEAGDRLLVELATRLAARLRDSDVAARHGGDEFTVLLADIAGESEARRVADRLRRDLGRPLVLEGQRVTTTVSIGLALNTDRDDRASDLLRHADAALYLVKDAGRNGIAVFDHALRASLRKRVSDETELRDALADGQIVAWFQPIVDMRTGALVGAEALARWLHPEHGVLLPARFLPLLEDAGLLPALGRDLAAQVFALRRDVDAMVPRGFRITLNIGVRDQSVATIVDRLVHQSRMAGVAPTGIALEITENAVIGDVQGATTALSWARRHGFTVMLDDFGTGWSSLSLLRDLPLDALKIDQSFVRGMGHGTANAAIVAGVLDLASRLDLYVVAEGVEDVQDVDRLRAEGAIYGQGFRWSPAVPPPEFLALLAGHLPWVEPGAAPPIGTTVRPGARTHPEATRISPEAAG